jgi:hypothetical protein
VHDRRARQVRNRSSQRDIGHHRQVVGCMAGAAIDEARLHRFRRPAENAIEVE